MGTVLDLEFTILQETAQILVNQDWVEIDWVHEGPIDADLDRFRRASLQVELAARALDAEAGSYALEVHGRWAEIARAIPRLIGEISGVGEGEVVRVEIS